MKPFHTGGIWLRDGLRLALDLKGEVGRVARQVRQRIKHLIGSWLINAQDASLLRLQKAQAVARLNEAAHIENMVGLPLLIIHQAVKVACLAESEPI